MSASVQRRCVIDQPIRGPALGCPSDEEPLAQPRSPIRAAAWAAARWKSAAQRGQPPAAAAGHAGLEILRDHGVRAGPEQSTCEHLEDTGSADGHPARLRRGGSDGGRQPSQSPRTIRSSSGRLRDRARILPWSPARATSACTSATTASASARRPMSNSATASQDPASTATPGHEPAAGLVPDQPEPLLRELEVGFGLAARPARTIAPRWATSSCAVTASSSSVSAAGHAVVALDEGVPTSPQRVERCAPRLGCQALRAAGVADQRPDCLRRSLGDDLALGQAVLQPDQHQRVDRIEGHVTGGIRRQRRGDPSALDPVARHAAALKLERGLGRPECRRGPDLRLGAAVRDVPPALEGVDVIVQLHRQGRDRDGQFGPVRRPGRLFVDDRRQLAQPVATKPSTPWRPKQPFRELERREPAEAPVLERLAELRHVVAGGSLESLRQRLVELATSFRAEPLDGRRSEQVMDDLQAAISVHDQPSIRQARRRRRCAPGRPSEEVGELPSGDRTADDRDRPEHSRGVLRQAAEARRDDIRRAPVGPGRERVQPERRSSRETPDLRRPPPTAGSGPPREAG